MTEKIYGVVSYFGGKGLMSPHILPLLPERRVYVEPFCGAASVFLAKKPSPVEVLNDINKDIINLFRVLQDKGLFEELRHKLMLTPYARDEFARALELHGQGELAIPSVEKAWAFFVLSNQGFAGKTAVAGRTGWGTTFVHHYNLAGTVNQWLRRLAMLDAFRWRLMMAQIDSRDALEVIQYWDSPDTVFYIDPPYVHDTRKATRYTHEMSDEQHEKLIEILCNIRGAAVVSGYPHPLYTPLDRCGYKRHEFQTVCHGVIKTRKSGLQGVGNVRAKAPRTEVVWVKQ